MSVTDPFAALLEDEAARQDPSVPEGTPPPAVARKPRQQIDPFMSALRFMDAEAKPAFGGAKALEAEADEDLAPPGFGVPESPATDPFARALQLMDAEGPDIFGQAQQEVEPEQEAGFVTGVKSGIKTTEALFQAAAGVVGQTLGADEFAENRMQAYDFLVSEAEALPRVPFEQAFDTLPNFFKYAAQVLGEQVPVIASVATGAGVGALVGRLVARGAIKQAASKRVADRVARLAAERGLKTGAFAAGTALGTGEVGGELREAGLESPGVALAGGLTIGALELMPWVVMADLLGLGKAARSSLMSTVKSLPIGARIASGAALTGVTEAGTETLQELTVLAAHKFVDENFEALGEEGRQRVLEAAVAGGLVGGLFGGAGGAFARTWESQPGADDENQTVTTDDSGVTGPAGLAFAGDAQTLEELEVEEIEAAPAPTEPTVALVPYTFETKREGRVWEVTVKDETGQGNFYEIPLEEAGSSSEAEIQAARLAQAEGLGGQVPAQISPNFSQEVAVQGMHVSTNEARIRSDNTAQGYSRRLLPLPGEQLLRTNVYQENWEGKDPAAMWAALEYDLPGASYRRLASDDSVLEVISALDQAGVDTTPIAVNSRSTLTAMLTYLKDAREKILRGASDKTWQEVLEPFYESGLMLRPNDVQTKALARFEADGYMTRDAILARVTPGSEGDVTPVDHSITLEALRRLGVTEGEQRVELDALRKTIRRVLPQLTLVRTGGLPHANPLGGNYGARSVFVESNTAGEGTTLFDNYAAPTATESWIFRVPGTQWISSHYPSIPGYFGHVRVHEDVEGETLTILEIQDDYSQQRGSRLGLKQQLVRDAEIVSATIADLQEQVSEINQGLTDFEVTYGPMDRDGLPMATAYLELTEGVADLELRDYQDASREVANHISVIRQLQAKLADIQESIRRHDSGNWDFDSHTERAGTAKAAWLLRETMLYAQRLGYKKVEVLNATAHANMQNWFRGIIPDIKQTWERTVARGMEVDQDYVSEVQKAVVGAIDRMFEPGLETIRGKPDSRFMLPVMERYIKDIKKRAEGLVEFAMTGKSSQGLSALGVNKVPGPERQGFAWVKLSDSLMAWSSVSDALRLSDPLLLKANQSVSLQDDPNKPNYGAFLKVKPDGTVSSATKIPEFTVEDNAQSFLGLFERYNKIWNNLVKDQQVQSAQVFSQDSDGGRIKSNMRRMELTLKDEVPESVLFGQPSFIHDGRPAGGLGATFQWASQRLNADIDANLGDHC